MDRLKNIRAKARRQIEKAKREIAIAEMLPDPPGLAAPLIVQQKREVWICYKAPLWRDVLAIFDAYATRPGYLCKADGWAARMEREERDDVKASEVFAWVVIEGSVELSATATFCAFAVLPDGTPAQIRVAFESAHYRAGPWHPDLSPRFCNSSPSRKRRDAWSRTPPPFLGTAAMVATWRTGAAIPETAFAGLGIYMTRGCLAGALSTLEGAE